MDVRPRCRRAGQALVEMALVLPLVIVLVAGLIDIGRWLDTSWRLSRAAADASHYGAVRDASGTAYPTDAQVSAHALESLPARLQGASIAVNSSGKLGGQPAVAVRLTAVLACFTPGFGSGITLTAERWFPRR